MKTVIVILSLLAATAAYAQFNGCPPGFCSGMRGFGGGGGGFSPNAGAVAPAASGKILLADGVSFLLKVDGASKLCRAGGC